MSDLTLRSIKDYLMQQGQVTLTDLSYHFHHEPELIKSMLQHWIQKGKVVHLKMAACDKGCCHSTEVEIYRWVKEETITYLQH